ncbi:MAG: type II secretion system F family protein [Proteobacteria bacterium]|nr:type II secretion system F family protein [Pseudomonadota bacterium]
MPVFRYKAVSNAGELATGELEAANEAEIVGKLRDQGLMPMQVSVASGSGGAVAKAGGGGAQTSWFTPKRVTADQLMSITRELATLLRAGLPLDRALETLIGLAPTPAVRTLLQGVRDDVRGGKSLSQALDARRDVFSRFYVNIVRAGEAGGALGAVLTRLADTMERNKELKGTIASAMIYPIILICVAVVSVMVLLLFVVPQFKSQFAQAGKSLPLPTTLVIAAGEIVHDWWWLLAIGVVVAVWWGRRLFASPAFRRRFDAWVLRRALLGELVAKIETARFSRTLGTLLGNGVTLLAGLSIVKETMGNAVMGDALDGVIASLREGKGFGRPLMATGVYPRLATQMILVGEESGRLEEMLNRVADVYDREVQVVIKRFLAVMEPVMILGLAVIVGFIVLSILLGVLGMSELVS